MQKGKVQAVESYVKHVGKGLKCDSESKREILSRLKSELYEAGYSDGSYLQIVQDIGKPEEVSRILLKTIPREKLIQSGRRKTAVILVVAALLILLIIGIALIVISKDRGNFVTDKDIPSKESVYRVSGLRLASNNRNLRQRFWKAWGTPVLSREDFDCWAYKDAHLIIRIKDFRIEARKSAKTHEYEIIGADNGHYVLIPFEYTEGPIIKFDMDSVLLLQEENLHVGDVITLEYDPEEQLSEYSTDLDGQRVLEFHRIFGVAKIFGYTDPTENDELDFERSIEIQELWSTGIVIVGFGWYIFLVYAIYRLLTHLHYKKTWRALIPFFNLFAVIDAVKKNKKRTLMKDELKDEEIRPDSDSPELDENGLLSYITMIAITDRR